MPITSPLVRGIRAWWPRAATLLLAAAALATMSSATNEPAKSTGPWEVHEVLTGAAVPTNDVPPSLRGTYDWYLFANHCHSGYSRDSSADLAELMAGAAARGADAFSLNDHGTYEGCDDPAFQQIGDMIPICGEEWSGVQGGSDAPHAVVLNVPSTMPHMTGWPIADMIEEVHAAGGSVIANHPFMIGLGWPEDRLSPGIDGVEVWNGTGAFARNSLALAWWQEHLAEGRRITGMGGTDIHEASRNALAPCNYVLARSPNPDDIQDAVNEGRVGISKNETGPRVYLWADLDGALPYDIPMGTNIELASAADVYVRVRVTGGEGEAISLHIHDRQIWSGNVNADPWELRASARLGPQRRTLLRAELRSGPRNGLDALSNPIYVNYPAD